MRGRWFPRNWMYAGFIAGLFLLAIAPILVDLGLGLIAVYLSLINGVVHVIGGVILRAYNPGLATAVLLFLSLGTYTLILVSETSGVSGADHAIALAFAVLLHVSIFVHLRRRVAALSKGSDH